MGKKQSLKQQILFGACFGVVLALTSILREQEEVYSFYSMGRMAGGAIGCAFLYCILYRFWPK